jgi:hypothetical protein
MSHAEILRKRLQLEGPAAITARLALPESEVEGRGVREIAAGLLIALSGTSAASAEPIASAATIASGFVASYNAESDVLALSRVALTDGLPSWSGEGATAVADDGVLLVSLGTDGCVAVATDAGGTLLVARDGDGITTALFGDSIPEMLPRWVPSVSEWSSVQLAEGKLHAAIDALAQSPSHWQRLVAAGLAARHTSSVAALDDDAPGWRQWRKTLVPADFAAIGALAERHATILAQHINERIDHADPWDAEWQQQWTAIRQRRERLEGVLVLMAGAAAAGAALAAMRRADARAAIVDVMGIENGDARSDEGPVELFMAQERDAAVWWAH